MIEDFTGAILEEFVHCVVKVAAADQSSSNTSLCNSWANINSFGQTYTSLDLDLAALVQLKCQVVKFPSYSIVVQGIYGIFYIF